jgi:hypothetical protein
VLPKSELVVNQIVEVLPSTACHTTASRPLPLSATAGNAPFVVASDAGPGVVLVKVSPPFVER